MSEQRPLDIQQPPPPSPPNQPGLLLRSLAGHTIVELHGEIDLKAAAELHPYLDSATRRPFARVIVDLRPVTFIDCSGLSLLVRADQRIHQREGRLLLVCTHPLTLRMLNLTGLEQQLPPHPTINAALSAADTPHPAVAEGMTALDDVFEGGLPT